MTFQNVHNDKFIGDPVKWRFGGAFGINGKEWDRGIMDKYGESGHHMICDVKGNGLRWSDINDGMRVKLRTRNPHFEGYEYLYTSELGKYFNLPKDR